MDPSTVLPRTPCLECLYPGDKRKEKFVLTSSPGKRSSAGHSAEYLEDYRLLNHKLVDINTYSIICLGTIPTNDLGQITLPCTKLFLEHNKLVSAMSTTAIGVCSTSTESDLMELYQTMIPGNSTRLQSLGVIAETFK